MAGSNDSDGDDGGMMMQVVIVMTMMMMMMMMMMMVMVIVMRMMMMLMVMDDGDDCGGGDGSSNATDFSKPHELLWCRKEAAKCPKLDAAAAHDSVLSTRRLFSCWNVCGAYPELQKYQQSGPLQRTFGDQGHHCHFFGARS